MNTRDAKNFIRKCRIDNNTVLLVKEGSEIAEQKELIGKAITAAGLKGVVMLLVEDLDDVKVFNKLDMNRIGWYRLDDVRRLVSPKPRGPFIKEKSEEEKGESS